MLINITFGFVFYSTLFVVTSAAVLYDHLLHRLGAGFGDGGGARGVPAANMRTAI
eukprot:EC849112.1.p3 GENE.EC849112.1~~EC849112.1.p3  ORF type:complete len:55 (-),score=17.35 EC849112.1:114-278(-)